jgi:hypothetical protein
MQATISVNENNSAYKASSTNIVSFFAVLTQNAQTAGATKMSSTLRGEEAHRSAASIISEPPINFGVV